MYVQCVKKLYAVHISASFPLPPLKFGPAIERRHGKSVLRVKTQCVRVRSMYVSTLEIAGNGPKWRFRTRKAAASFSLPMHQYGHCFPFSR